MRTIGRIAVVVVACVGLSGSTYAGTYGGGLGTAGEPYQIWTAEQMNEIGLNEGDWDEHFVLMDDISLGEFAADQYNIIGYFYADGWDGIRNKAFTGSFEGNDHVIDSFSCAPSPYNSALFGYIGTDGIVRNLNVSNASITTHRGPNGVVAGANYGKIENCHVSGMLSVPEDSGGLVGMNFDQGVIINCSAECTIIAGDTASDVGGLVGFNNGTVVGCHFSGSVSVGMNSWAAGGLIGRSYINELQTCRVEDCYATGSVTGGEGSDYLGGLIGTNGRSWQEYGGVVKNCYSTGEVTGGNGSECVGGLAGLNCRGEIEGCYSENVVSGGVNVGGLVGNSDRGSMTASYSRCTVSGVQNVGGLVGKGLHCKITVSYSNSNVNGTSNVGGFAGTNSGSETIVNCYSHGTVEGETRVGGFVGYGSGILYCYSTGEVRGNEEVGGFAGRGTGSSGFQCYWDVEASRIDYSYGGEGRTTSEMKSAQTYQHWGHCDVVWKIDDGNGYPTLVWEDKPGELLEYDGIRWEGSGTYEDPYLIGTAEELNLIGLFPCELDKHFRLIGDIDLSGIVGDEFNIIGTVIPFVGVFDGAGHVISNFTYETDATGRSAGLFAGMGAPAIIKHLGLENANVVAEGCSQVGGLVGNSSGTICECYATGNVSGLDFVGGLVGYTASVIADCYADVEVAGNAAIGGIVGKTYNTEVLRCYSVGRVEGTKSVGGLVGYPYKSTVTTSFYDYQTSMGGGTNGRTTEQMQAMSTFAAAGWDFVGGTVDGIEDIWFIPQGDYPRLWWEGMKVSMKLTPRTLNCGMKGNWVKAHLTLPEGFTVEDVDADRPAVLHSFGFESAPLNVFVNKDKLVEIEAAFRREDFCSLASDWPDSLTVYGFFRDGSIFLGTSTVRIITPGLKDIHELGVRWLEMDCSPSDWCDGADLNEDSMVNFADFAVLQSGQIEFVSK